MNDIMNERIRSDWCTCSVCLRTFNSCLGFKADNDKIVCSFECKKASDEMKDAKFIIS